MAGAAFRLLAFDAGLAPAFAAGFARLRAAGPAATAAFLLFFLTFVAMSLLP